MEKIFIVILSYQISQRKVIEQTNNKLSQDLFDYYTLKQKKKTAAQILLGSIEAITIGVLIGFVTCGLISLMIGYKLSKTVDYGRAFVVVTNEGEKNYYTKFQ